MFCKKGESGASKAKEQYKGAVRMAQIAQVSKNSVDTVNIKLEGILDARGSQHFSYLIYRRVGKDEKYYELKPNYHDKYRAGLLFNEWWKRAVRRDDISDALVKRAYNILMRSSVRTTDARYLTTIHRYVDGVLKSQRHVIGLRITDEDFDRLNSERYLRETKVHLAKLASNHSRYVLDVLANILLHDKAA